MLTLLATFAVLRFAFLRTLRRGRLGLILGGVCLFAAGCGYVIGNPFPMNVRTVHVPTFTTETYRRGFELQLTEAVQKQIMQRTPFQLVSADEADTRLIG